MVFVQGRDIAATEPNIPPYFVDFDIAMPLAIHVKTLIRTLQAL